MMKKIFLILTVLALSVFAMAACESEDVTTECNHPDEYIVSYKATTATCTTTGLTAGKVCTKCDTVISGREVIEAFNHSKTTTLPGKPATCSESGYSAGAKCVICGTIVISQAFEAQLPHTIVASNEVAATCSEAGSTGGTHCSVCFVTIEASTPTEIDPTNHRYEWDVTTAATETTHAIETGVCSYDGCDATATREIHTYEWAVTTEPYADAENKVLLHGIETGTCIYDGCTETASRNAHAYSTWETTLPATATTHGFETAECSCAIVDEDGNVTYCEETYVRTLHYYTWEGTTGTCFCGETVTNESETAEE